jgi:hypothetical protein
MAYFQDNSPCPYFGDALAPTLRAVGWLDPAHPHARGKIAPQFAHRLADLLREPWQPLTAAGIHTCSFCRLTNGTHGRYPTSPQIHGFVELSLGCNNLFVPSKGFVFVAPSLVIHYIDCHEYAPPSEFVEAVIACPPMRSMEYLRSLARASPALVSLAKGSIP